MCFLEGAVDRGVRGIYMRQFVYKMCIIRCHCMNTLIIYSRATLATHPLLSSLLHFHQVPVKSVSMTEKHTLVQDLFDGVSFDGTKLTT